MVVAPCLTQWQWSPSLTGLWLLSHQYSVHNEILWFDVFLNEKFDHWLWFVRENDFPRFYASLTSVCFHDNYGAAEEENEVAARGNSGLIFRVLSESKFNMMIMRFFVFIKNLKTTTVGIFFYKNVLDQTASKSSCTGVGNCHYLMPMSSRV